MFINHLILIVTCVTLILPVTIEGVTRSLDQRGFRVNSGEARLLAKRQLHGHIIETPVSEEVALIEQQPATFVNARPGSVELIEEIHEAPRYLPVTPTDAHIIAQGSLMATPPHNQHLHLTPMHPVVNPMSANIHTATKVVEVSAINSDTGHSHRLGAFAVQPIIDHLHVGRFRAPLHHHQNTVHQIQTPLHHGKIMAGHPKSRVEMFHTQQQIETLDPVEEITSPNPAQPHQHPYYEEVQQQQQPVERLRASRLSTANEVRAHLSQQQQHHQRTGKFKFNSHQPETIVGQQFLPIVEEKVVYSSLANGHHPNHYHHLHPTTTAIHPVQPARLVIEDGHVHHHAAPPASVTTLLVEPPTDPHHRSRLVELTPASISTPIVTAAKFKSPSQLTRCRQNRS